MPTVIKIPHLSKADALELSASLDSSATLEEAPVPEGAYGELATITLAVIVTAKAVKAVADYLAERERRREEHAPGETVTQVIIVQNPDGSERSETLRYKLEGDRPAGAAAASALSALPGVAEALADGVREALEDDETG